MWETLAKIYDLKGFEKRNLAGFLQVKLFAKSLREGKKQ